MLSSSQTDATNPTGTCIKMIFDSTKQKRNGCESILEKEFSNMFDTENSKQQAKIVLQQIQKHKNYSQKSIALRIEALVKTAYTLHAVDYIKSVRNQTNISCLDIELKNAAFKKHANHKQLTIEPEMPFKTLEDEVDQLDLTRTITNNHIRLYEVNDCMHCTERHRQYL